MGIISHSGSDIHFHRLSNGKVGRKVTIAKGFVSGTFNASVDKTAIEKGFMSIMLTENKSQKPNSAK